MADIVVRAGRATASGIGERGSAVEGMDAVLYAYDKLTGKTSAIPKSVLVPNVVATTANAGEASISKYFYISSFSG